MSVASNAAESAAGNAQHLGTIYDGGDKLYCSMQNGQAHMAFIAGVNATNGYVDSGPTTPLLSGQYGDDSEDDGDAAGAGELSSDSLTDSSTLLKPDGSTTVGEETSLRIALQVFFPYLVAGFGMVGAGAVLEIVKVTSSFYCDTWQHITALSVGQKATARRGHKMCLLQEKCVDWFCFIFLLQIM